MRVIATVRGEVKGETVGKSGYRTATGIQTGYKAAPLVLPRGRRRRIEREREGEKEYHSREDDEGKVEDDDAMDPQGTTAQITD